MMVLTVCWEVLTGCADSYSASVVVNNGSGRRREDWLCRC